MEESKDQSKPDDKEKEPVATEKEASETVEKDSTEPINSNLEVPELIPPAPLITIPPESLEQPKKKNYKYELVFVLASLLVLAVIVYPLLTHMPSQAVSSSAWCGYSVSSSLQKPQPQVTSVSASWTIPTINLSLDTAYSAAWIGMGGQFDETLIQVGTEHDSVVGQETYSVWYELLPRRPVTISSIDVSPGDIVTASISLTDSAANMWTIQIRDITTGNSFQRSLVYDSSMLTAEWIVERPLIGGRISPLVDFGRITFTGCSATINGVTGNVSSFPSSRFTMNNQNSDIATASQLASSGTSFSVDYKA